MDRMALRIAGIVFLVVALVHLARLVFNWTVTVNGCVIPVWTSGAGFFMALVLALWMFRAVKGGK